MFLYYRVLAEYHRDPIDPDDLFDGLRNMAAESEINNPKDK